MSYELHYWPGIQGRGEFVRLALEAAGAEYRDVAREGEQGMAALAAKMQSATLHRTPFAPPFLVHGRVVVAQTSAILLYLGPRLGLVARSEADRLWTHQIQLTLADAVAEAHDAHHPISSSLYYEDQKPEAQRRARYFRQQRLAKFLGWFERVLECNPGNRGKASPHLVGARLSYADLSLYQVAAGLDYAFPKAMRRHWKRLPHLAALQGAVARHRRVAAYLTSDRRLPFNEQGLFRHYPELDG